MGLFDKKYCDICGEKIGLLGNRKLEDGNMCKDCAKKLSPFFSDRRSSTVNEIKQQLSYREQNKQVLAGFSPMFTFGESDKVYIDPMKMSFVVSRRNPGSWSDENPDVIPISSVSSCNMRIDEDKDEIFTQGSNGEQVSYNPPRYNFYYNFYVDINVNNPYFDDIEVKLNNSQVEGMGTMEYHRYQQMAQQVIDNLSQNRNNAVNMGMNQGYAPNNGYGQPNGYVPNNGYNQPNGYAPNNGYNQPMNNGYNQQPNYGQPVQPQAPVSQAWVCRACNTTNEGGRFCQACGTPRG